MPLVELLILSLVNLERDKYRFDMQICGDVPRGRGREPVGVLWELSDRKAYRGSDRQESFPTICQKRWKVTDCRLRLNRKRKEQK